MSQPNKAIPTYEYCLYRSVKATTPDRLNETWQDFTLGFLTPKIAATKADRLNSFSPGIIAPGKTRSAHNVERITMAVIDMDQGHDPDQFIEEWESHGLTFLIYTTWSHTAEKPKWRAVFPFSEPVKNEDWEACWHGLNDYLAHSLSDPACKNSDRVYFYPYVSDSESIFDIYKHSGKPLDPTPFIENYVKQEVVKKQETKYKGSGSAGDDYEQRASHTELLEAAGFTFCKMSGADEQWVRPGKDPKEGHSATWGPKRNGMRFYIFSSTATHSLPIGQQLTKFAIYAYLYHGGDFSAAAKDLAKQGYGSQERTFKVVEGGKETETGVPVKKPDAGAKARELTDMMNGARILESYGNQFRFVAESKQFTFWDGSRWHMDPTADSKVRGFAKDAAINFQQHAFDDGDEEQAKKRFAWAIKSMQSEKLNNALKEAASLSTVSILNFDQNPWILNCKNGMVDLRTGELLEHDRDLLMSQVTGCDVGPDNKEQPKEFLKFIERIMPDPDTRKFLFQFLGYSLTGNSEEQCYVFFHGSSGNNGKSTLIALMQYILGDYAMTLDTEAVMQTKGFTANNDYELARLRGKRFAAINEVSDAQKLNEALIKRLTGNTDTIKARQIREKPFEFQPVAKIFMTGNNKPAIYGQEDAIWKRVNLIPFEVSVPREERDPKLIEKLRAEGPVILRWLVYWCLNWQKNGLERSEVMLASKEDYKEENDFMNDFVVEQMMFDINYEVSCTRLHQHYLEWARNNGCPPMKPNIFGRVMSRVLEPRGVERIKGTGGHRKWKGVDVRQWPS